MFKTVLLDGELKHIRNLKKLIADHCPKFHLVGEARTEKEALDLFTDQVPDLVIVDVQFPKKSAFDFLDHMGPQSFELVFTAENDRAAYKSIKKNGLDYLLKPYTAKDLQVTYKRAVSRLESLRLHEQIDLLYRNISTLQGNHSPKIAIPTVEGFVFIQLQDIIRCEANGAYTFIFTTGKQKIIASRNIKEYEDILPKSHFFRIHNSHLVNINHMLRYNKGRGGTVTMQDGTQIEVASRRRNEFLNLFQ